MLIALGAALVFVMKTITEKAIAAGFDRHGKEIMLRLERRSRFEERILLDQYVAVGELLSRIVRVTTDLNRHWHGATVDGLFREHEVVPLTEVYEKLSTSRYLLGLRFHSEVAAVKA